MSDGGWKDRLFGPVQVVATALLFAESIAILGAALFPAVALLGWAEARLPPAGALRALGLAVAIAAGWFAFGLALLAGTKVGPGEIWAGVPARRVGRRRPRTGGAP